MEGEGVSTPGLKSGDDGDESNESFVEEGDEDEDDADDDVDEDDGLSYEMGLLSL